MYTHIPNDAIIIIIIIALTISPVFILIITVACDSSSSVFVSSSISNFATFTLSPKFDSPFSHFSVISNSLLSLPSKLTSVSNVPSGLVVQYSGTFIASYPLGIISNTFAFPAMFTLFVTFILYVIVTFALFILDDFISNFDSLSFFIGIFSPSTFILLNVLSTEKSMMIFLFVSTLFTFISSIYCPLYVASISIFSSLNIYFSGASISFM